MNYTYPPVKRVAKVWREIVEHLRREWRKPAIWRSGELIRPQQLRISDDY